jgi:YHS domain-containing protein
MSSLPKLPFLKSTLLKSTLVATALVFGAVATPAFAAEEVLVTTDAQTPNLAVQGYDVIAYRTGTPTEGSSAFTAEYDGATYRFASQANLDTFNTDPARYVPAFGGFCAYGVAKGKKFDVDPTAFSVVDDVLYLNYNAGVQSRWNKKQSKYITDATGNWSDIRATAASDL